MGECAPVITVPSQWVPTPITRIMLAYDGGKLDRFTLKPLIDLAKRTNAEVVLAHVRDNSVAFDKRADRKQVAELLVGIRHSFVTVQGDEVAKEINDLAKQGRIQLVAVIHRQKGFWESLFHSFATTLVEMSHSLEFAMHHLPTAYGVEREEGTETVGGVPHRLERPVPGTEVRAVRN
jgi:nucleotide-binding universal stress UspA family protein